MPDTVLGGYKCPCGWVGNSRQALYWHRHNNKCVLRGKSPIDTPRSDAENNAAKALLKAKEPEDEQPAAPVLKPDKKVVAVAAAPDEEEEEEPEEEEEREPFEWVIIPIILVMFIVAGLFVFREKVVELLDRLRAGKPPAYGVPDYVS